MPDDDELDVETMKDTMDRVAAYRAICAGVRSSANGTLINAALWLGLSYFMFRLVGFFYALHIVLGVCELLIGLVKKFRPALICVLLDGILLTIFGGLSAYRQYTFFQAVGRIEPIWAFFTAIWIFQGLAQVRNYFRLRALLGQLPSGSQLRYVDDLVAEIRNGDPGTDPTILELPTSPPMKAKLLGAVAFFVDLHSNAVTVAARDEVEIERKPARTVGKPDVAYVTVDRQEYPGCTLSEADWANYARWKGAA